MGKYDITRFRKMRALEAQGIDPYPAIYKYTCCIDEVVENEESYINKEVTIIGRVTNKHMNNELLEGVITGGKSKLDFRISSNYKLCSYLDEGDIIQMLGRIERDNTLRLNISEFAFVTKSLREYPIKNDWFQDCEKQRFQYEISLLLSDELKEFFIKRSKTLSVIRNFLSGKKFMEVDTPILLPSPVMAPVKDFSTTVPESNPKCYLRISNTDLMRRYLISGFERIFHIGKFFRDEPLTYKNYFEFTMLTFGLAYGTYHDIANIIEETTYETIEKVFMGNMLVTFRNKKINLERPWKRITMQDAINEYANIDIGEYYDEKSLREKMREKGIIVKENNLYIELIDILLDNYVLPNFVDPTYIVDFPHAFGGPAKELSTNSRFKQRCELFINGVEVANMSTHQNNPIKLRQWFEKTLEEKVKKGWKQQELHEDYFFPMEIGSPPCASGAVGIDRLLMVLMNIDNIIDIVPFPWNFRPKTREEIK